MAVWSVAIYTIMSFIGFQDHLHDIVWSLFAAVALLIGLIGNVWIFFLIVRETPWQWVQKDS